MTMIIAILMMVVMVNVIGFAFRIGFGILRGVFRVIGFLITAALVVSFAGVFFLPVIIIVTMVALIVRSAKV